MRGKFFIFKNKISPQEAGNRICNLPPGGLTIELIFNLITNFFWG